MLLHWNQNSDLYFNRINLTSMFGIDWKEEQQIKEGKLGGYCNKADEGVSSGGGSTFELQQHFGCMNLLTYWMWSEREIAETKVALEFQLELLER